MGANGYHSLPQESYRAHALYRGNKDEFLTAYHAACQEVELAVLNRVANALRIAPAKVWLLSVVAKEDLWWPHRTLATAFYATGPYADVVAGLAAARGASRFRHELVRTSLLINNFSDGEGEPLEKNAAGYDHRQQVQSVRRLFEALDAVRTWETAT